MFLFAYKR